MEKEEEKGGPPHRELYALLHISPEASDEEIRKAYRQWAQIYHPDKYQDLQMKEVATQNFQRICRAYEILSDENKRQIYDIYGMEGLTSGLELGPNLKRAEEIKAELERLKRAEELEKASTHFRPSGVIMANLSIPSFLKGDGIMTAMSMVSDVQSQLSKRNAVAISGTLAVKGESGGAAATALFRHELSSVSTIELVAAAGLRSLIGVQTDRQLSSHSSATMGLSMSLKDGSINLSNNWTRQLTPTSNANIELNLGPDSSIGVGWRMKQENMAAAGIVKLGTNSFGVIAHYSRKFSSKSHGRITGKIGSNVLELEVGGGRMISNFSNVRMLYTIGIQGISWRFELHRGGQKLIIPILLSKHLDLAFATGAFFIPTSLYFALKTFVFKPYNRRREKMKSLENKEKTKAQVKEARAAAQKAQQLLQNVANRKKEKQSETDGLVIVEAIYGSPKALKNYRENSEEEKDELTSNIIDVTIPLNFLVNESGQLKLHEGIKKSGIMGFYDPCPGEPKKLNVRYTYAGNRYEVEVDDFQELNIPQEAHIF